MRASFIGPPLEEGPLPALFYFALSGRESLHLDPLNQPALFLAKLRMRVFSLDLPGHPPGTEANHGIEAWIKMAQQNENFVAPFVEEVSRTVQQLLEKELLIPGKIAAGGLSRGAFMATHLCAHIPHFKCLLGFAPLTKLSALPGLAENPLAEQLNLRHQIPALSEYTVRFYIGNQDRRVGTAHCFHFIEELVDTITLTRRPAPVELLIGPSLGHQGHGTAKETFHQGASWLAEQLGVAL